MDAPTTADMLEKSSAFISKMLGKPETYVMVSIQSDTPMMFGGDTRPLAFISLKSIGLPAGQCSEFSTRICNFIEAEMDISPDRIFIDFSDLDRNMFGWNGKTF